MIMTLLLAILSPVLFSVTASARPHPDAEWKIIRTEHADLIYDAKHQALAQMYAEKIPLIEQNMSSYFSTTPERWALVIRDETDLTNGSATAVPYNVITLYPVLPSAFESIGETGDWPFELLTHEYTHILSFSPVNGIFKPLRWVFGSIVNPSMLLPRWWLEGIAVEMETRTSQHGRLRSLHQEAAGRALTVDKSWDSITVDSIGETSMPDWPYGSRPYLYGSFFWHDLLQTYKPVLADQLSLDYSARIPYFLEGPLEERTQLNHTDQFEKSKQNLKNFFTQQTEAIDRTQNNFVSTPAFTENHENMDLETIVEAEFPALSPDGQKMVFSYRDEVHRQKLAIYKPTDHSFEKKKSKLPSNGTNRVTWLRNGRDLLFDKIDKTNPYIQSSELFLWNTEDQIVTQLTHGERAREAVSSPDDQQIAFIGLQDSHTFLKVLDPKTSISRILASSEVFERFSSPVFVSTKQIAFIRREHKNILSSPSSTGLDHLMLYDLDSNKLTEVSHPFTQLKFLLADPTQSTDIKRKFRIYMTAAEGRVLNAHALDVDLDKSSNNKTTKLTHTQTAVETFAISVTAPATLYYSELSSHGWKLRKTALTEVEAKKISQVSESLAPYYQISGEEDQKLKSLAQAEATRLSQTAPSPTVEEYSAWPYMKPHYWFPYLFNDGISTLASINIGSSDPLEIHAYTAQALYNVEAKAGGGVAQYTNQQFAWPWTFLYSDIPVLLSSGEIARTSYAGFAALQPDVWAGKITYGIYYEKQTQFGVSSTVYGPQVTYGYSSASKAPLQIMNSDGAAFSSTFFYWLPEDPSANTFRQASAQARRYFENPWKSSNSWQIYANGTWRDKPVSLSQLSTSSNTRGSGLSQFSLRGYPTGQLLALEYKQVGAESALPVYDIYKGYSTFPLFLKRLSLSTFAEATSVNGYGFVSSNTLSRLRSENWLPTAGAELTLDATIGYQFATAITFGVYTPLTATFNKGTQYYLSLNL